MNTPYNHFRKPVYANVYTRALALISRLFYRADAWVVYQIFGYRVYSKSDSVGSWLAAFFSLVGLCIMIVAVRQTINHFCQ